jgi:hypothetical protein
MWCNCAEQEKHAYSDTHMELFFVRPPFPSYRLQPRHMPLPRPTKQYRREGMRKDMVHLVWRGSEGIDHRRVRQEAHNRCDVSIPNLEYPLDEKSRRAEREGSRVTAI